MKYIIIALFCTTSLLNAVAQKGSIEGIITHTDNITLLPGANVYLQGTNFGAVTNGNGYYKLENIPFGEYILTVSNIGYNTIQREITVQSTQVVNADFSMIEAVSVLNEVVVMTKGNTGLQDIPGSAHYISPKEIQKFSYTDINRTLRAVPGVNIQEEDGFGLRPNIGLRGTGVERSSKITIMEDGVLIAPAPYADPAAYYFPTIGRMQGVEIVKGSSQIKYGPYTTGGAINLISTQIPDEFSGRLNLFAGSFGSRSLHAFAGNSHKHIGYMVEAFQYGSDGFKQLDAGGSTGFDKKDYQAKFRINTDADAKTYQSLTFKIGQTAEESNETYLGLTDIDFSSNPYRRYSASQKDLMKTEQSQFSATHFIEISKSFNMATTAYRSNFKRNWYKLDSVIDSTGAKTKISDLLQDPTGFNDAYDIVTGSASSNTNALFVRANNRAYYAQGIQTILGFNFSTNTMTHDINLGIRYHHDEADRFQWDDQYAMTDGVMQLTRSGTPGTESNRLKTASAFATYIQYRIRYQNLTVTPGIRYENITLNEKDYGKSDPDRTGIALKENNNQVDVFIPGIGLDYEFTKYLSVFTGVHKGFSPPGPKDETQPEESINYEAGIRYTKNALSGQAVFFYNDYSNLLGSDLAAAGGGGSGDLFNAGEVQTRGFEFQVTYDVLSSSRQTDFFMPVAFVYTYTNSVFQNSFVSTFEDWGTVMEGDHFPYLATNHFAFLFGLEHKRFSINASGRYSDEMRTAPGQGEIPANEKTDAYFIIDASANYVMHRNISLFASITNITDKVYSVARRPAGLRPGMPRALNIGVKAIF